MVDAKGHVTDAKALSAPPEPFQAALDSVKYLQFARGAPDARARSNGTEMQVSCEEFRTKKKKRRLNLWDGQGKSRNHVANDERDKRQLQATKQSKHAFELFPIIH